MGWQGFIIWMGALAAALLENPPWNKPSWNSTINPTIESIDSRPQRPQAKILPGKVPHTSANNWVKALLSKVLPTRARPSFSHHLALPSGSLHKTLSLLHQRADRSKKNNNPTTTKTKATLQKANQHEKAESHVPDEGTR